MQKGRGSRSDFCKQLLAGPPAKSRSRHCFFSPTPTLANTLTPANLMGCRALLRFGMA
jgi:hypothetical protein